MAARPTTEGRRGLVAVTLSDVPITVRRAAAAPLLRVAQESGDAWTMIQLTRAVESPSDRVWWIPRAAYTDARARRRRMWKP